MLCAKDLKVGYEDRIIIDNLNLWLCFKIVLKLA